MACSQERTVLSPGGFIFNGSFYGTIGGGIRYLAQAVSRISNNDIFIETHTGDKQRKWGVSDGMTTARMPHELADRREIKGVLQAGGDAEASQEALGPHLSRQCPMGTGDSEAPGPVHMWPVYTNEERLYKASGVKPALKC